MARVVRPPSGPVPSPPPFSLRRGPTASAEREAPQGQAEAAPLRPAALAQRMRQEFDQRGAGIRATGFTANQT